MRGGEGREGREEERGGIEKREGGGRGEGREEERAGIGGSGKGEEGELLSVIPTSECTIYTHTLSLSLSPHIEPSGCDYWRYIRPLSVYSTSSHRRKDDSTENISQDRSANMHTCIYTLEVVAELIAQLIRPRGSSFFLRKVTYFSD